MTKWFTIDAENAVDAFATKKQALAADIPTYASTAVFSTEEEISEAVKAWPASRIVEIWNGIPGVAPVKRFTDRKTAVARIWKAIQSLELGEELEPQAPQKPGKAAPKAQVAPQAQKKEPAVTAPACTPRGAVPTAEPKPAREGTRRSLVIEMISRAGGATLDELMAATGWQPHSIRGTISTLAKGPDGLKITSMRRADRARVYVVAGEAASARQRQL